MLMNVATGGGGGDRGMIGGSIRLANILMNSMTAGFVGFFEGEFHCTMNGKEWYGLQ
jgi:hypothetical protein